LEVTDFGEQLKTLEYARIVEPLYDLQMTLGELDITFEDSDLGPQFRKFMKNKYEKEYW
jgi:hypothetical protein